MEVRFPEVTGPSSIFKLGPGHSQQTLSIYIL